MARTEKYADAQIIAALREARGLVYIAASAIGCAVETVYQRIKNVPAVKQALDEARGLLVDKAEGKLADAVELGESWAVTFTLKTLGKDRGYVERTEHAGKDGGPIRFVTGLEDDDLDPDAGQAQG